jgi:hypothetical protein
MIREADAANLAADPCSPDYELRQLAGSPERLNEAFAEAFVDPERMRADNVGPHVVVVDDFYEDPQSVRAEALQRWDEGGYFSYDPPDPAIVGYQAALVASRDHGSWVATAFVTFLGAPVLHPQAGWRYNPGWLRQRLEDALGESIDQETWETDGDHWNGACHLIDAGWVNGSGRIHHHFKRGDLDSRGWSGLVYLSPDLPANSGTSLWRNRETGRCVSGFGPSFSSRLDQHDLAHLVVPAFNRLVLFRENVLHRPEAGTGSGRDARLTQTFFFRTRR